MVKNYLGDTLRPHQARWHGDRERKSSKEGAADGGGEDGQESGPGAPKKRKSQAAKLNRIGQQRQQTLAQMLSDLPNACDRGTKCNAQGYKNSWNGYKLHVDTADCGAPISVLLTSASVHG